jgi:signal transduction histidine kinase
MLERSLDHFKKKYFRSLFGRLALVWLLALLVGHLISNVFGYIAVFDDQIARTEYYLAKDLAFLLPALEIAPVSERDSWIKKMRRQAYHYEIGEIGEIGEIEGASIAPTAQSLTLSTHRIQSSLAIIAQLNLELQSNYRAVILPGRTPNESLLIQLQLRDGAILTAILHKTIWPINWAGGLVFSLQVLAIISFTWLAVKQATRPLSRLAEAAELLGSSLLVEPIPEDGPSEVARAAAAFNAMQIQIKNHLAERVQILAAISHDLQTPITRMRLRAELIEDEVLQEKFQNDLDAMQALVEEGIAFARSSQRTEEKTCRVDVDALIDSVVCDYVDAEKPVHLFGEIGMVISTRPNTLKRILINLIDNGLKFAGEVEIHVSLMAENKAGKEQVSIVILDRGPGIPEEELIAVLQPFYRVENSRNRASGGTGLGLAIAQQLARGLDGDIQLFNREGGGLEVKFVFSVVAMH